MKFLLKGRIELSGEIGSAKKPLDEFLKNADTSILAKGAPEGKGPRILKWTSEGNEIKIEIESGTHVRAHEALIRLKKGIGQELGKKYKMGARSVVIDEYEITIDLKQAPKKKFKVPFVESIDFSGEQCTIIFKNLNEEFILNNYIDRILNLISKKVEDQFYEGKAEYWELYWSSPEREAKWNLDPTEEMVKRGWLKQGPTKGKWFYKPELTAIFRAMEKIAVEEILQPLGFQEVIEPHHVPFDVWIKTGHMTGSPNEIYYVSEPKTRDPEEWEAFRDYVYVTHKIDKEELMKLIEIPNAGICYAQCPVIYWALSNATISDKSLPLKLYDRSANSNRYESGGRHGIERVDEFHRLEPVYIGTAEQLLELRDKFIERYKYVFNEILELEWRMVWVTPWYLQQSGQIEHEEAGEDKIKGTIDFESYMPYRGSRKESEWLEFQNLSIIGDKFIKAFNIKPQKQKSELWSGCSGIGLERWTAAFLAQKSLEVESWPEKFQKVFGTMPEGIELL
ncbi:MAG: serine--tRNA ligase [Thermoplasmata archaeon]|nr:MAG: serine--tRNA ligase [Thermoplasmata archaeon]